MGKTHLKPRGSRYLSPIYLLLLPLVWLFPLRKGSMGLILELALTSKSAIWRHFETRGAML